MKTGFDFSKVKKAGRAKSLKDMYAGGAAGDGNFADAKPKKKLVSAFQAGLTPQSKMELYDALSKDYQDPNVPIHPRIKNWLSDFYGRVWQENYGVGTADEDMKPFSSNWTAMTEGISGINKKGDVPFSMGHETNNEHVEDKIVGLTGVPKAIRFDSDAEVHFHPMKYFKDGKVTPCLLYTSRCV